MYQLKGGKTCRLLLASIGGMLLTFVVAAQHPDTAKKKSIDSALLKTLMSGKAESVKPYREIITTEAHTSNGFFKVHTVGERFYFEVPDSLLGRDILAVNRIIRSAADLHVLSFGYPGDEIGESVIRFVTLPGRKVALETISFKERSADSSENGLYRSLQNSNFPSMQAMFPVKAYGKDSAVVLDMTDYLNGDNNVLFFDAGIRTIMPFSNLLPDRSYIEQLLAFPMNIEVKTVKTYALRPFPGGLIYPPATYELNSSLVLLPKVPMTARRVDPRVGFFADEYTDFDVNPQGVKKEGNIWRWRMEPRPEDREKYQRGELVEPQKPIVVYIDPLTPKKWVPYLIRGINDWQAAFEKAGFKNAIMGKEAPVGDSTWNLEDARHSVLVYKPSDVANAMGPSVKDPRSGEILETHISWYHNVMDVLYKWYFIQTGAVDPRAQKPKLDDSLMGELIRFVSSHEVGHTLGLRHNYGASSTVPVDSLRSKRWVEAHGHTPSIMDYARFNYVAQPEDHISEKGLFPRIGDYDKWAIEWGYKWMPGGHTPDEEKPLLDKMVVEKLASGRQYYFGSELDKQNPRNQNEDLGDDAMKAGDYGIRNLKRIEVHLLDWTKEPGGNYEKTGQMYQELVNQYQRYMGHVIKNIGGVMNTPKSVDQPGAVFELVSRDRQRRAVTFLNEQLFQTPYWLMDQKLYGLISNDFSSVSRIQQSAIDQLLNVGILNQLISQQAWEPALAYTPDQLLSDLEKGIFSEVSAGKNIDQYRRNLQKMYVEALIRLLDQSKGADRYSDVLSVVKVHAKQLAASMKRSASEKQSEATKGGGDDRMTRAHLADLSERLTVATRVKDK